MEFKEKNALEGLPGLDNLKNTGLIINALNTVAMHKMLDRGDSVLVSISGGPDSVFLLYFLNIIKERYGLELSAFHLDHITRDGDSTKDAAFVKNLCSALGVPVFSEKISAADWCRERKLNFQEGARLLRKDLLDKYKAGNSIKKIAVAHNADDSIETFLMNLVRGSGLRGLGSIKPVSGAVIRPLIYCRKAEIIDFLESNNISYCTDSTNFESKYFRNRIRNKLIPYLENEIDKDFREKILKTIDLLRVSGQYIDARTDEIIDRIQEKQKTGITDTYEKGYVKIDAAEFAGTDDNIKTHLAYRLIELVKGNSKEIISKNIADILKFCTPGGENKKINLPGGIVFIKEGDSIYIFDSKKISINGLFLNAFHHKTAPAHVKISGKEIESLAALSGHGKDVNGGLQPGIIKEIPGSNYNLKISLIYENPPDMKQLRNSGSNEAYMDLGKIMFPVLIRNWEHGDKFIPLGMDNEKKLQDFFIDSKMPLHLRDDVPVFCDKEKIIWIGGMRMDNRVKVDSSARAIIHLVLESK